jgi:hypothetical protein
VLALLSRNARVDTRYENSVAVVATVAAAVAVNEETDQAILPRSSRQVDAVAPTDTSREAAVATQNIAVCSGAAPAKTTRKRRVFLSAEDQWSRGESVAELAKQQRVEHKKPAFVAAREAAGRLAFTRAHWITLLVACKGESHEFVTEHVQKLWDALPATLRQSYGEFGND